MGRVTSHVVRRCPVLEKQIEKAVCDYAKSKKILAYKFSSPGHAAVPDRMFVMPGGKMFMIEFKAEGKKPTAPQIREHIRLMQQGISVYVVDNVEEGILVIDLELDNKTSR